MRRFMVALAGLLFALAAQAQAPLPDQRKTLACLVKAGPALQVDDAALQPTDKGVPAYVRLRMVFERADRPPVVEVLASTAANGLREAVLAHVAGYRLPCLGDRPVAAVQEFQFAPDLAPQGWPLLVVRGPASTDPSCAVPPAQRLEAPMDRDVILKALVLMTFTGDGAAAPSVQVLRTNGGEAFRRSVTEHVAATRVPCRKAGDWPWYVEQMFVVRYGDRIQGARFTKPRVSLEEFLGYMLDARERRLFLDLDTMHCPFTLRWTLNQPWARNQVQSVDGDDPNRVALHVWLASLKSGLKPELMEQLVGESLLIDVPCGQLNLKPAK